MKQLRRIRIMILLATVMAILLPATLALAAGSGGSPIVLVADTRNLDGIMLFWANLYNESHLQFMLLTIILIPAIGVTFGLVADVVMGWIGIDLTKRNVH